MKIPSRLILGCLLVSMSAVPTVVAQDDPPPGFTKWLQPQSWVRDRVQPVFTIGEKGAFDSQHIIAPNVIFFKRRVLDVLLRFGQ